MTLSEIHRFEHRPVKVLDRFFWDILKLIQNNKEGLHKAGAAYPRDVASLGVASWGVDFALLDKYGNLLANPYCSRDPHVTGVYEEVYKRVPKEEIFEITGLQFMEINSLPQLMAIKLKNSPPLDRVSTFLHIADLFNYWLTGIKACEYTIASTSQLLDARTRQWSQQLISQLDFPVGIFPQIVEPGTLLGHLRADVARELGLAELPVAATASHDTASAVVSVPTQQSRFAYLSSGTWGLLGTEISEPLITDEVYRHNLANEGGVFGTIRLLRNIANMWFLQECRYYWAMKGERHSWAELMDMACQAEPFQASFNPDDPLFIRPDNMPDRIRTYCRDTGQKVPHSKGDIIRVCLENLAFRYREVIDELEEVIGHRLDTLHIVSGGARNDLLNQYAANVLNRPVVAGPYEATTIGNVAMQMVATGDLHSLDEARQLVATSFDTKTFDPSDLQLWEDSYGRYRQITAVR